MEEEALPGPVHLPSVAKTTHLFHAPVTPQSVCVGRGGSAHGLSCPWQPSHLALQVVVVGHLPQRAESTKTTLNRAARVHTAVGDTEAQELGGAAAQAPPTAPPHPVPAPAGTQYVCNTLGCELRLPKPLRTSA